MGRGGLERVGRDQGDGGVGCFDFQRDVMVELMVNDIGRVRYCTICLHSCTLGRLNFVN